MISISKPFINHLELAAVRQVLKSGQLASGPFVKQLEHEFAKVCGTKYAITTTSGTTALHTALWGLGIGPGDEVITTPFTFIATANAIVMCGAKPVFADISMEDFNLDPDSVELRITKKTKAILAVNLYGQPANYDRLRKIAKKYHLGLIEDAAQSINASYQGKKSVNLGDVGCFSMYATKNIMCGEGGMITCNDDGLAKKMRQLTDHGQPPGTMYTYDHMGWNYQMSDLHASVAVVQLAKVDEITRRRQRNAAYYTKRLSKIRGIVVPKILPDREHVFHQYTLRVTDEFLLTRDALQQRLLSKGISSKVYYPIPLYNVGHLQDKSRYFPVSVQAAKEVLSIPVHPLLKQKDLRAVVKAIYEVVQKN